MIRHKNRYTGICMIFGGLAALTLMANAGRALPEEASGGTAGVFEVSATEPLTESAGNDSIRQPSRMEAATAAYKNLKFIQYDGVTEDELYPAAMDTYKKIIEAMEEASSDESEKPRLKAMIRDMESLLHKGSAYYSGSGDAEKMSAFATAYVDLRLNPELQDLNLSCDRDLYAALIYCAASSAYNSGDYPRAISYLDAYLKTGVPDRREQVATFLGQASLNAGTPDKGIDGLIEVSNQYPTNFNLLMLALQCCLDSNDTGRIQPLLTRAMAMRSDDEQLLNVQGWLFENEGNFTSAIDMYERLYEKRPSSLPVNQHLALCYYNLGAEYYNKAITESDEKLSKRYSRQAQAYFSSASGKLETVVENDPTNLKYLRALALTYGCQGNQARLNETNTRLQALGASPLPMNGMPEVILFSENANAPGHAKNAQNVPDYQDFAKGYVEKELAEWSRRGEFEKTEDYEKRMTRDNVFGKYEELCKKAEADYIAKYAGKLRISDLSLEPYDVDNESYLIKSAMGPIIVHVPLKNKEAEAFKSTWNSVQLRNPRFFIKDNRVAIASVDLITPAGKTYHYNSEQSAGYDFAEVKIDMKSFIERESNDRKKPTENATASKTIRAKSDVDVNIPMTSRQAENTAVLIIGNENYKKAVDVECALNDAETFAKYCTMTLGVPEHQVLLLRDATYAEMLGGIHTLRQLAGTLGDSADIIVYYAGHGFPDEKEKDAYLLPTDSDGRSTATAYPLKKLYSELSDIGAENVMVFLDACFSGATRSGGMLTEARGVALKPREAQPAGNMFVLSATSDQETALPYKEKNHGLFTYFLLKKLQETKGNVTLKDLSRYVEESVKKNSMAVNQKMQTPHTSLSGNMNEKWENKKLR